MSDQTRPDIENMPFSDLVELTCQLRARACNPQCSEQLHNFSFEVSNTLIKRIKELEAKLNEVPSTIQEFVDRIEKLEDTIAEQRLRRKIEMTLKATIAEQRSGVDFTKNYWVNPTGE